MENLLLFLYSLPPVASPHINSTRLTPPHHPIPHSFPFHSFSRLSCVFVNVVSPILVLGSEHSSILIQIFVAGEFFFKEKNSLLVLPHIYCLAMLLCCRCCASTIYYCCVALVIIIVIIIMIIMIIVVITTVERHQFKYELHCI